MGRIKPPSGGAFRPEAKPGYMNIAKAQKGKNWSIGLDDTVKLIKGAETVYTSPLLRDVVGAGGEIYDWMFGDDAEEPTVAAAAEAKVKAKAEPAAAPAPAKPEPAPTKPRGRYNVSFPEYQAPEPVVTGPTAQPYAGPEAEIMWQSGHKFSDQTTDDLRKAAKTISMEITKLENSDYPIGPSGLNPRDLQTKLRPIIDEINRRIASQVERQQELDIDALVDQDLTSAGAMPSAQELVVGGKPALDQFKKQLDDLVELGTLSSAAANKMYQDKEAEVFNIINTGDLTPTADLIDDLDVVDEGISKLKGVPYDSSRMTAKLPDIEPPALTPATARPEALVSAPSLAVDSIPPTLPVTPPREAIRAAAERDTAQAIYDVNAIRSWLSSSPPAMQELVTRSSDPTGTASAIMQLQEQMNLFTPPQPQPEAEAVKLTEGMNLGEAQAAAAQLALSGGSQADLATLLKDVNKVEGVSSVGGGFGRWVAGGRGGYFMDPGAAAQEIKKAYDTAIKARATGQSKQLMDAYRRQQIIKSQADVARLAESEARKAREGQSRMSVAESREARQLQMQPIKYLNEWRKGVGQAANNQKKIAKLSRKRGKSKAPKKLSKDDINLLKTYQSQLNSQAKSFEGFVRSNTDKTNNRLESLKSLEAKAAGPGGIDPNTLTEDEIVALYGSDKKSLQKDRKRAAEAANNPKKLQKAIEDRKIKLAARARKVSDISRQISDVNSKIMGLIPNARAAGNLKEEGLKQLNKLNAKLATLKKQLDSAYKEGSE